jgi:hypothetical protein
MSEISKIYDYRDESGELLFQTVRYEPKDFKQRRPDRDNPGQWLWNLDGVKPILYRLPELIKAPMQDFVIICEQAGSRTSSTFAAAGMSVVMSIDELFVYSNEERAKWREWFIAHPEALAAAVQPEGQLKAARALGMSDAKAILFIILPQAMRLSIPGWSNEYSIVLKDSAVAYALGVAEVMARAHFVASRTYQHLPLYFTAGVHDIGLRVTDNTKLAYPGSGQPNLTNAAFGTVDVRRAASATSWPGPN